MYWLREWVRVWLVDWVISWGEWLAERPWRAIDSSRLCQDTESLHRRLYVMLHSRVWRNAYSGESPQEDSSYNVVMTWKAKAMQQLRSNANEERIRYRKLQAQSEERKKYLKRWEWWTWERRGIKWLVGEGLVGWMVSGWLTDWFEGVREREREWTSDSKSDCEWVWKWNWGWRWYIAYSDLLPYSLTLFWLSSWVTDWFHFNCAV